MYEVTGQCKYKAFPEQHKYTFGSFILGEDCLCSLHTGLLPRTALGSFWKPSAVSNQP